MQLVGMTTMTNKQRHAQSCLSTPSSVPQGSDVSNLYCIHCRVVYKYIGVIVRSNWDTHTHTLVRDGEFLQHFMNALAGFEIAELTPPRARQGVTQVS